MTKPEQSEPHLRLIFLNQIQQIASRRVAQSPAMCKDWHARKQFGRGLRDEDLRRLVQQEEDEIEALNHNVSNALRNSASSIRRRVIS